MPSWTDRILYRSNMGQLVQVNYDCNNLVKVSDHRPVFAQYVLAFDQNSASARRALRENIEVAKEKYQKRKTSKMIKEDDEDKFIS